MKSDYPVMLDACVLLPMPLADTLLRMAETPRLYLPRWSDEVLKEISRNLVQKFGKTQEQANRRECALRDYFPEAFVAGYEELIPVMRNDPKDRHVLAACVASGTKLIVTYNQRDFPIESRSPYAIHCCGPSTFLIWNRESWRKKLTEQAQEIGLSMEQLLLKLHINVPGFVSAFCEAQKIDLNDLQHFS